MVATDGHRLAYIETEIDADLPDFEIVVPQKGINELQRMISSGAEQIHFGIMENHIVFKVDAEVVLTRLVDGKFPNYSMVIPESTENAIMVNRESLYNSLRRVSLFSDLKVRGVKLDISENLLRITASTPEYGEAKDEIIVEYDGDGLTVGFNVNYLLDLLRAIDTEMVAMRFNDPSGPVLFEPDAQSEYHNISIVMPMIV